MSDLTPIVAPDDFPASTKSVYLNTASVCLMYSGAERAVVEWMHDLAENGTIHFDEAAEERAFATLHASAARLFSCRPEEIAVGSSATELLASLAWAVAPTAGSNIVSTGLEFPSTIYPWARVARHTGAEVRLADVKGRLSSGRRSDRPDRSPDRRRLRLRCDLQHRPATRRGGAR